MRHLFYRNVRARDQLEILLVAAVSSLLLLRFGLYLSGYPSVGGAHLHIAHMLYGGLLMLAAMVLMLSFLGARIQRLSALLGGAGFGIFIDELGKFLTRDNNYFFRPTVGIIYAIFISLFLLFNFLTRRVRLAPIEYELNALLQFEEAVLRDMDAVEKARIRRLLKAADANSPVVPALTALLEHIETVRSPQPGFIRRRLRALSRLYRRFWRRQSSRPLVAALFVAEAVIFLIAIFGTQFANLDDITALLRPGDNYGHTLIAGQLLSSLVAAGFAVWGALRLRSSRRDAFEQFRRATLINLFLTEFFLFSRIQFGAIPSFLVNLVLLLALRYAIHEEQRPAQSLHK